MYKYHSSNHYSCLNEHSHDSQLCIGVHHCLRVTFTFLHTVFVIKQYLTVNLNSICMSCSHLAEVEMSNNLYRGF